MDIANSDRSNLGYNWHHVANKKEEVSDYGVSHDAEQAHQIGRWFIKAGKKASGVQSPKGGGGYGGSSVAAD